MGIIRGAIQRSTVTTTDRLCTYSSVTIRAALRPTRWAKILSELLSELLSSYSRCCGYPQEYSTKEYILTAAFGTTVKATTSTQLLVDLPLRPLYSLLAT